MHNVNVEAVEEAVLAMYGRYEALASVNERIGIAMHPMGPPERTLASEAAMIAGTDGEPAGSASTGAPLNFRHLAPTRHPCHDAAPRIPPRPSYGGLIRLRLSSNFACWTDA